MSSHWVIYPLKRRQGRGSHIAITHRYMAGAPGCPTGPHPTRDCGCKPFRTVAEAQEYVRDLTGWAAMSYSCLDGTCPEGQGGGIRRCHSTTCGCVCHDDGRSVRRAD